MDLISRKYYADKVDSWLGKSQIIVLVGQRRIGKSFVLKDFMLRHEVETDTNIIYIDKEKKDFDFIKNYTDLNDYIDKNYAKGKHNFILIDEIQDIEELVVVDKIHDKRHTITCKTCIDNVTDGSANARSEPIPASFVQRALHTKDTHRSHRR